MRAQRLILSPLHKNYLRYSESLAGIRDTATKPQSFKKNFKHKKKCIWQLFIQYFYLFEYELKLRSVQQQLKEDLGIVPGVR